MPIKLEWKRLLFLAVVMVMVVSLFIGCGGEEEEKPLIKLYDGSWESLWISNAIGQYIIENGYGYPTETVVLDTPVMQVALASGDIQVSLEHWSANIWDWHVEELEAGNIIEYAVILEGGPQFFMIPEWVHEEYNIDTIFDMKDHADLFPDPEDPSKGYFINCKIGWQCQAINAVKLQAYGLGDLYNRMEPGSGGAMDAAYVGAMLKEEPIFGYYWAPTALMGMYDWYVLEEPEYDADLWDQILAARDDPSAVPDTACAYDSKPLTICVHKSFPDMAPDVVEMFKKMVIGLDAMNKLAAWSQENEVSDYKLTAIHYLREYDSTWKTWVPTDVYNKVKDALAEED